MSTEQIENFDQEAIQFPSGFGGLPLQPDQITVLSNYVDLLLKWNYEFHFSKYTNRIDLINNLLVPSLAFLPLLPPDSRIIDLGCGPGIPSVPLAVVRQDLLFVCLDSYDAAIQFIIASTHDFDIRNVQVVHDRAEIAAHSPKLRSSFNCAIARAFAPIPIVLEIASALLSPRSSLIIQCSDDTSSTLQAQDISSMKVGCVFDRVGAIHLGEPDTAVNFVIFHKIADTPPNFPRSWPSMKRRPIWT
jgi:16S rRNA (guanine527-N7)-methyltransferase